MKVWTNILSFLLVIIFTIPAAGFYYYRHNCSSSGNVSIVFHQDDHSCCEHLPEESDTKCCSNEGAYLTYQDEFTQPGSTWKQAVVECPDLPVSHQTFNYTRTHRFESRIEPPPLIHSSRRLLLEKQLFLI